MPKFLQTYVMETTEVRENLGKLKKILFAKKMTENFVCSLI